MKDYKNLTDQQLIDLKTIASIPFRPDREKGQMFLGDFETQEERELLKEIKQRKLRY